MFADLFGFGNIFGGEGGFSFFGDGGRRGPPRTQDIQFELGVTLAEFYLGTTKKLKVQRDVICIDCQGKGSTKEGAVKQCDKCNGRGQEVHITQPRPGMIQQSVGICSKCQGRKEIVNEKDACKECKGKKVVKRTQILEVAIQKGMAPGTKVKFKEAADQAPGAQTGDIVVVLVEKPDPSRDVEPKPAKGHKLFQKLLRKERKPILRPAFKRLQNGKDLLMEHELTLSEALLGYEIAIEHLDDRTLVVQSPPKHVTGFDEIITVEGEGMPVLGKNLEKGDLFIKLSIHMPNYEELSTMKSKLASILPPVPSLPSSVREGKRTQRHTARVFDAEMAQQKEERDREDRRHRMGDQDEDDDHGPRAATCQQQ